MNIKITLLIRKTIFRERKHPYTQLQSKAIMYIDNLNAPTAHIDIEKGIGNNCTINRNEQAFVKFLLTNYGTGRFSIQKSKKFAVFWSGYIEKDRYIREKGSISPYIKSQTLRQWHVIEFNKVIYNDDDFENT